MITLVKELRTCGIRLALVSNSWGNSYPCELLELFDVVVNSGEVGLRKPQREIFDLALGRLDLEADDDVVFVDDGAPNIAAAEAFGLKGILHTWACRRANGPAIR